MRKLLTAGVAALTLVGAIGASATPAAAQHSHNSGGRSGGWHGSSGFRGQSFRGGRSGFRGEGFRGGFRGRGFRGDGDDFGFALGGFALGAALAGPYGYGYDYDYGPGYYGDCVASRRVWDPYVGHWVWRRVYTDCDY